MKTDLPQYLTQFNPNPLPRLHQQTTCKRTAITATLWPWKRGMM